MITNAGKVWRVNAENENVLLSAYFNALCVAISHGKKRILGFTDDAFVLDQVSPCSTNAEKDCLI